MKKLFILFAIALQAALFTVKAQQLTEKELIPITPMISEELNMNAGVIKALENKARQMLTSNGIASQSNRILLTSNIVELSKDVTPTAPPLFDINMEVTFCIVDIIEETIINEMVFEVKGTDKMEHKAYIKAINKINTRSEEARDFITKSKSLIIEYYDKRLPVIIKKAETLAAQELYDDAIATLCDIPESVKGYTQACDMIQKIYMQKINHEANLLINDAQAFIAVRKYDEAIDALINVSPMSKRSKDAQALVKKIQNSIAAEELAIIESQIRKFELQQEEKRRIQDDETALNKMKISAARDIGVSMAENNKPKIMKQLGSFFKSIFK